MDEASSWDDPPLGPPAHGRSRGQQRWENMLFLHWPVAPSDVQRHLPAGLTPDTWNGEAWVGLVAFRLRCVPARPCGPLAALTTFLEVNLRTYVRAHDRPAGIWFLSMDAASTLAVLITRLRWNFSYHRALVHSELAAGKLSYSSRRLWPSRSDARLRVSAEIDLAHPISPDRPAMCAACPGALEHFLTERYVYYARSRSGRLTSGKVAHQPYALYRARVGDFQQSLTSAAGIHVAGPPHHAIYSPGVSSHVYEPAPINVSRGRVQTASTEGAALTSSKTG